MNVAHSTQLVRDLAWAVTSRSLLIDCPMIDDSIAEQTTERGDSPQLARWQFDQTQIDPDHLSAFLAASPIRGVGRYFERLILYWLKYIRQFEIVANSLQLRDGKRTIGEIDFLFYDEQCRMTHWETAVKFYLHFPGRLLDDDQYIGPNATDTLERKTKRLLQHQLPRSQSYFPEVKVRAALVKGRIFYHPRQESRPELPSQLSPDHLRGLWIRNSELDALSSGPDVRFRRLHKPLWLSDEVGGVEDEDILSADDLGESLRKHFATSDRAVLISELTPSGQRFVESNRIFVVSDRWPQHTSQ